MSAPIVPRETRKIYEGRVFTVQLETIALPKAGEMTAEIVRHPGSVVIIPITTKGEVVLVRQYRHAVGRWLWELPAGSLKPGENPEKAAKRECYEETGLIAARVERLGTFYPTPGYCDEAMTFYRATGLREPAPEDEPALPDEDEDIETRAFTKSEVGKMIAAADIADLKTVAGLALMEWK